jgi:hypothetical protein
MRTLGSTLPNNKPTNSRTQHDDMGMPENFSPPLNAVYAVAQSRGIADAVLQAVSTHPQSVGYIAHLAGLPTPLTQAILERYVRAGWVHRAAYTPTARYRRTLRSPP